MLDTRFVLLIFILNVYCSKLSFAYLPNPRLVKTKEDLEKNIHRINPIIGSFIKNINQNTKIISISEKEDLEAKDRLQRTILNLLETMVLKYVKETKRETFWTLRQG